MPDALNKPLETEAARGSSSKDLDAGEGKRTLNWVKVRDSCIATGSGYSAAHLSLPPPLRPPRPSAEKVSDSRRCHRRPDPTEPAELSEAGGDRFQFVQNFRDSKERPTPRRRVRGDKERLCSSAGVAE